MRMHRRLHPVLLLLSGLLVALATAADIPPRQQAPNDQSEFRRLTLDNGLKVILLSDPKLNKSSASLSVAVGSYAEPAERQGLAHFLEHMLFLGTEKYPDESEYNNFLQSNGGYSNAYTVGDHTNYHFEIRHEALEGALDRFCQFFIAPLFTAEFTDREMNAVNSEFQMNLENDGWREFRLRSSLYRAGHPAAGFNIGNRETLTGTTREELLDFHRRNYSANRMTLALTGRASLDHLEQWARQYFAPVQNHNYAPIAYPADFLVPKAALRIAFIEPIKDLRKLQIEFPLPPSDPEWQSKPVGLLSFILGYEGEGSLLSQLKAEGLATALGAGGGDETNDYGSFSIAIDLTPDGLKNYHRVLALVFAAVADLRRAGYPDYLFRERQALALLDERFVDKGEGADRAVALANAIREFPFEIAEREPFLWVQPGPAAYERMLAWLRPDNMLVTVMARGVPTDATEHYSGTRYSYREETGAAYEALLNPPQVAAIHLPKPNPFIPQTVALLPEEPVRLVNEPALSLYFSKDAEFFRPMVAQIYRFRLPRSLASLETAVLLRFYEACVNEALNETSYTAAVAGLRFSCNAALEGVFLTLSGYDTAAPRLLDEVTGQLVNFTLSEERFAALKDRIVRELANFPRADAWQILLETRRSVVREFHYRPDEQLPVAEKVTLAQVRDFARRLYARGRIEALIHGNIAPGDAVAAARRIATTLKVQPVAGDEVLRRRLLTQTPTEALFASEKLVVNNSAFQQEYLLGGDAPEIRAATMALANIIADPFYSEMRTRQQLGYIVFGGAGDEERTSFAYFIIQSGDHPADDVQTRAEACIAQLPELVGSLPDEAWAMVAEGVRAQLEEKDKSIAERAGRLFALAYDYDGDWSRREATLAALDSLTRERVRDILAAALAPATRQTRTFLGFGRDHQPAAEVEPTFADRAAWKKKQTYR